MRNSRRRAADARAEALARALESDDIAGFDTETRELVELSRMLRPTQAQSEARRAATRDRILHGARTPTPRRPADPIKTSPVTLADATVDSPAGRVRLADVESIDPERAAQVSARIADVMQQSRHRSE